MVWKCLPLIYLIQIGYGVIIKPYHVETKGSLLNGDGNKGWKIFKILYPPKYEIHNRYEPHHVPKYHFEYAVSDVRTGDHKRHYESRDADRVRGAYSLLEPDGSIRHVEYHADDHHGFQAVVTKNVLKHDKHSYSIFKMTRHPIVNHHITSFYTKPVHEKEVFSMDVKPLTKNTLHDEVKRDENAESDKRKTESSTKENLIAENTTKSLGDDSEMETTTLKVDTEVSDIIIMPTADTNTITTKENLKNEEEAKEESIQDSVMAPSYYVPKYYYYK